jgi:NADH-quinone oxidoreductase subunit H
MNYHEYSLLIIVVLLELESLGVIFAGFLSGNKLALMGILRSISQKIAFNISISLNIFSVIILAGSFNLLEIVFIQHHSL